MADLPPDSDDDHRTPRWVTAFGIIAVVLVVLFVLLHLMGGGMRGHAP